MPFEDKVGLLAGVSATRLVFGFHHIGNVNVGVGVEILRLQPRHRLMVVEVERMAELPPSVVSENAANTVVAMRIDGPMCEHHIRLFTLNHRLHFGVALLGDFARAIHLRELHMAHTHNGARIADFLLADSLRLIATLAWNACLAASEIHIHHLAARALKHQRRATAAILRVVGVRPDNQRLLILSQNRTTILSRQRQHRHHQRKNQNHTFHAINNNVLYPLI